MSRFFPEPYENSGGNVKDGLDLSNYTATGIDISTLVSKTDFPALKAKEDNLVVDKVKTVRSDLSKLTNVVDNKKTVYDKLAFKVSAICTNIPSTSGLVTKIKPCK